MDKTYPVELLTSNDGITPELRDVYRELCRYVQVEEQGRPTQTYGIHNLVGFGPGDHIIVQMYSQAILVRAASAKKAKVVFMLLLALLDGWYLIPEDERDKKRLTIPEIAEISTKNMSVIAVAPQPGIPLFPEFDPKVYSAADLLDRLSDQL